MSEMGKSVRKAIIIKCSIRRHVQKFPEQDYEYKENNDDQVFNTFCREDVVKCKNTFFQVIPPPFSLFTLSNVFPLQSPIQGASEIQPSC